MPMAYRWGEPALIDSVISKRQKPHLQEPGWFCCFNKAKIATMFVCACLQSDSDLSHAESKFRDILEKHINLPTPLWQMLEPCQMPSQWVHQRKPSHFPMPKPSVQFPKCHKSFPSPQMLWYLQKPRKYSPSVKSSVCFLLFLNKLNSKNHNLIQLPHCRD